MRKREYCLLLLLSLEALRLPGDLTIQHSATQTLTKNTIETAADTSIQKTWVKNHLKTPESQKACSLKATASFERHALVIKGNLIIDQNLKAGFSTSSLVQAEMVWQKCGSPDSPARADICLLVITCNAFRQSETTGGKTVRFSHCS